MSNLLHRDYYSYIAQTESITKFSIFKKIFQHNFDTKVKHNNVRKSYIAGLSSRDAVYISIGQLHLMSIDFMMKFNMVSEPITHLDSCLFY